MAEAADASPIKNVADTALWVATYRAQESERPDALFHDRQAGLLAGDRGRAIAAAVPYPAIMSWILVIRTVALDRLIHKAISLGIDTVVNLGAGLDTRPYRMELPPSLRWIEVDFAHMLDYKSEKLAAETPACRMERISVDLSDRALRRSLFEHIGSECRSVLIIAEGLIPYLSDDEAESLSKDLFAIPSFHFWLQDYRQGGTKQWVPKKVKHLFKDAPFRFDKTDWLSFFTEQGWEIEDSMTAFKESLRVNRPFPTPFPWNLLMLVIPARMQEKWRRASGYVLYKK